MNDQQMRELRPGLRGHDGTYVGFDPLRIGGFGKPDQSRQAAHMRVDGESGLAEGVAEHHVCGLPPDAGQLKQSIHVIGEFAVKLFDDGFCRFQDVGGFHPVKPAGEDRLFQFFSPAGGERGGVRPAFEKLPCDHVHAFVRALGRKDRRDEELKWRHMLQKALLGAVNGQQFVVDLFCQCGFHGCAVKGRNGAGGRLVQFKIISERNLTSFGLVFKR